MPSMMKPDGAKRLTSRPNKILAVAKLLDFEHFGLISSLRINPGIYGISIFFKKVGRDFSKYPVDINGVTTPPFIGVYDAFSSQ